MKKIKSISTLFVALMLIVSMLGTSVFAAVIFDAATNPNISGISIESNGVGGKSDSDSYYKIAAECTAWNSGFSGIGGGNVIECQFMLEDEDSKFIIRPRMYNKYNNSDEWTVMESNYLEISVNSMFCNCPAWSSDTSKWTETISIEPGKWYTLVAQFEDNRAKDEEEKAGKFYLNGKLIHQSNTGRLYGFRAASLGAVSGEHPVYVDNIIRSTGRGVSSSESHIVDISRTTPSTITSVGSKMQLDDVSGAVRVLSGTSVLDVKNSVASTDGSTDDIKIYNSDLMTLADNSDEAIGKVIVIVSKNNQTEEQAYSYYDIEEIDFDKEMGKGGNVDDIKIHNEGTSVESVPGLYGKAYSNEVYKLVTTKNNGIHLAKTFNNGSATCGKTWTHLEFSFALSQGAGIGARIAYHDGSQYGANTQINFEKGRFTYGSNQSAPGTIRSYDIKENTWYTFGVSIPSDGSADGKMIFYLNGKILDTIDAPNAAGFRQPFVIPFANTVVYVDDIMMKKNYTYNPDDCVTSWLDIDNAIIKGNKINYTVMPEASDFHPGANTNVRFYDAEWNQLASTENASCVVVGETDDRGSEGYISYYTFAQNASDYIAGGYYDKDNNFYVKAYGKNAGDSLYYATYESANNDELSGVVAGAMNTSDNKAEISGTFGDKPYRFFFWDKDINPIVKSIALELKK